MAKQVLSKIKNGFRIMLFDLIYEERKKIKVKRLEKDSSLSVSLGPYSYIVALRNYKNANDTLNEFSSYLQSEDYLSGRRARYKTGLVFSHLKKIAHEVPVEQRNFIIFPENPGSMDPVSLDEYGNNTKPELPSYCTIS